MRKTQSILTVALLSLLAGVGRTLFAMGRAGDAPDDTDPFATTPEPDPEEPDDMPGPPAEDCVDAPVGTPAGT